MSALEADVTIETRRRRPFQTSSAVIFSALCLATLLFARAFPGWIQMWAIVLSLFVAAKVFTLERLVISNPSRLRIFAYIFLWPGMDAEGFFRDVFVPMPRLREWVAAISKTLSGATLLWGGVRLVPVAHPLLGAWVGMIGLVFLLHFGIFHLLSVFWRSRGIDAPPMMRSPARATSLTELWGRRWNAAFRDWMDSAFFRPLARRYGASLATAGIFLLSGVLHELVISWPARGGFGWPTAYFALQAGGIMAERSRVGKTFRLGSGFAGRYFVVLVAGAPSVCLFHPTFIRAVILPMYRAIHAL